MFLTPQATITCNIHDLNRQDNIFIELISSFIDCGNAKSSFVYAFHFLSDLKKDIDRSFLVKFVMEHRLEYTFNGLISSRCHVSCASYQHLCNLLCCCECMC